MTESYILMCNHGTSENEQWKRVGQYSTMKSAKEKRQSLIDHKGWCMEDFRIDGRYVHDLNAESQRLNLE